MGIGALYELMRPFLHYALRITHSNQGSFQMVHFVLDDFGGEAFEFLFLGAEGFVSVFHFDGFVSRAGPFAWKGEASFFGGVGTGGGENFWIVHDHRVFAVLENDDGFGEPNHIRRQSDTAVRMGG